MYAAYCSGVLREHSRTLGHVLLIDHKPRHGEKIEFTPSEAQRYKERSQAERTNGRLKDDFGGRHIRVRGNAVNLRDCRKQGKRNCLMPKFEHQMSLRFDSEIVLQEAQVSVFVRPLHFEVFTKQPDSFGIRYFGIQLQTQKAHKRQPITDLVFDAVVGKVVQLLQHQYF